MYWKDIVLPVHDFLSMAKGRRVPVSGCVKITSCGKRKTVGTNTNACTLIADFRRQDVRISQALVGKSAASYQGASTDCFLVAMGTIRVFGTWSIFGLE